MDMIVAFTVQKDEKQANFFSFWPTVWRRFASCGEGAVGRRRRCLGGDGGGGFIGGDIFVSPFVVLSGTFVICFKMSLWSQQQKEQRRSFSFPSVRKGMEGSWRWSGEEGVFGGQWWLRS